MDRGAKTDGPFGIIVVELLPSERMISETTAKSCAQVHKPRSFFLLGDIDRVISVEGVGRGQI